MKKRLFAALLILVMAASVFSATAFADKTATYQLTKEVTYGSEPGEKYDCTVTVNVKGIPDDGSMNAADCAAIGDLKQTDARFTLSLTAQDGVAVSGVTGTALVDGKEEPITLTGDGKGGFVKELPAEWTSVQVKELSIELTHTCAYDETKAVTVPATCDEEGSVTNTCLYCGHKDVEVIDALGHNLVDVPAKAATCTEAGWDAYKACDREGCDYTEGYKEIAALGHNYGDWKDNGDGTHSRVCANDNTHVDKANHTVVTDAAVAATCTEDGKTEGSHCSDCGAVIKAQEKVPALGHKYGEWADAKDGKTHTRVCANDPKHVDSENHNFGKWVVTTEATQTTDGSKYHVCDTCGYKATAKIPAGNTKPQTGDDSGIMMYAVLLLTAVTGIVVTTGYAKKKAK